jgi:mRNA interferase HigB
MRIISRSALRDFSLKHPQSKGPLDAWFAEASKADWGSFAEVKATYRSADVLTDNRVIFNIGGNKYRLVVRIAYKCRTVYVRFVGTHSEYSKINAATV